MVVTVARPLMEVSCKNVFVCTWGWWGFDSHSDLFYANYINHRKCLGLCIKLIAVAITKACL